MAGYSSISKFAFFLCILAAVRVAVYLAAFPFFGNVDEIMHYDLVLKYSSAHAPRGLETLAPGSAKSIMSFGSPEYALPNEKIEKHMVPFYFSDTSDAKVKALFIGNREYWQTITNYESGLAPLYYSVAGLWARAGMAFGLVDADSLMLLYWIRFLNVFFIAALVWVSFRAALVTFPENRFMAIAAPLLVAVMPQDTFYSIQNDVLSPLCFGWAYLCAVRCIRQQLPSARLLFQFGCAVALTVLVKSSNLPVIILAAVPVTVKALRVYRAGNFQQIKRALIFFACSAYLPVLLWFAWNMYAHGDLLASEAKIKDLHWAHKPLSEWLNTGFLTSKHMAIFWQDLMASFWRGELVWASQRLAEPGMDTFYWITSLALLLAALPAIYFRQPNEQKRVNTFMLWSYVSFLLFIMLISISFEYRGASYPTFERPYFTSGRLISGALIPFVLLYLSGFGWLLRWLKNDWIKIAMVFVIAIVICISEYRINKPVFASPYNFYATVK